MRTLALAAATTLCSLAYAGGVSPPEPNRWNHNGSDAFRKVVTECLVAGLSAGAPNPVALANQCVEATQVIWNASYPNLILHCPQ